MLCCDQLQLQQVILSNSHNSSGMCSSLLQLADQSNFGYTYILGGLSLLGFIKMMSVKYGIHDEQLITAECPFSIDHAKISHDSRHCGQ